MGKQHAPGFLKLVQDARTRIKELTVDDVKAKLDRGEKLVLIDVREESEYAKDHIPGALSLGKGIIERDIEARVPDKDAAIVLYCGGGFRSALAADNVQKMGYANVRSMDRGHRGWREKGYPLTTEQRPSGPAMRIAFLLGAAVAAAGLLSSAPLTRAQEKKSELPKIEPKVGVEAEEKKGGDALFNGKDLEGWEGLTQYWSWKDGALVGYTPTDPGHNTFLCSKKTYKDFELRFKIRLKDGVGNSGVQIRSKIADPKKFTVAGPQCDIGQQYWGSLYGENFGGMMKAAPEDLVKKVVKPSDFNDYHIKVVGKHVTIKINGETMVDGDFEKMPDEGIIAWQLHAGFKSMEVTFKDIEFKDLSKK